MKKFYTFLFVDCLYVTIRKDYETKNYAVYVILGYDVDGQKDILGTLAERVREQAPMDADL
ncbi:MAG: transposase [Lacrimispora saccharolytica]